MRLPTTEEREGLYQQYHTPAHIQDHMRMVAAIATLLAPYHQVNVELVEAAALLHDLVRLPEQWVYLPPTIHTPLPHAEVNYLLLHESWPEVAEIIRSHSLMTILEPAGLTTVAAKIVYYADKRVNHDTIVSLSERLQFGQQRWQVTAANDISAELLLKLKELETELFNHLPFTPHQLDYELTNQTNRKASY